MSKDRTFIPGRKGGASFQPPGEKGEKTSQKEQRIKGVLNQIKEFEPDLNINTLLTTYKKQHFAFTPRQLTMILRMVYRYNIWHRIADFRMTMRRNSDKEQLDELEDYKIKLIWPYMSRVQKVYYNDYVAKRFIPDGFFLDKHKPFLSIRKQ